MLTKGVPVSLSFKDLPELSLTRAQNWVQSSPLPLLLVFWRWNFRHFANIFVLISSKGIFYFTATVAAKITLSSVMGRVFSTFEVNAKLRLKILYFSARSRRSKNFWGQ